MQLLLLSCCSLHLQPALACKHGEEYLLNLILYLSVRALPHSDRLGNATQIMTHPLKPSRRNVPCCCLISGGF